MLNVTSFQDCIRDNLKDRRFSKDRIDAIIKGYESRVKFHIGNGKNDVDASILAMNETVEGVSKAAEERAKRTAATLAVHATHMNALREGLKVKGAVFGGKAESLAMAAVSLIEKNPNFSALSYDIQKNNLESEFMAILGSTFDDIAIGAMGRQKGKAHIANLPDEMFKPGSTGDKTARALADAWAKVGDLGVERFNQAGGSMGRLPRYMPQPFNNVAKLLRAGKEDFVKNHMGMVDWSKTRFPSGDMIPVEQRPDFLGRIFDTKSSDGVNKIDPDAFRGQGRALGNALDQHRVIHYKDAASWAKAHELYGDGSPYDVMIHHIETLSHKIAALRVFGPNPDLAANNIRSAAQKIAYEAGLKGPELRKIEQIFHDKFDPMFELTMRKNPMNPDSVTGAIVTGANNVNTGALLGSAVFASFLGDAATTKAVRVLNGMPVWGGLGTTIRALALEPNLQRKLAIQSGFIMDGTARSMSAIERWNPVASMGPHATRRIADATIRASGMNILTNSQRWAVQVEQMGYLHELRNTPFDKTSIVDVMRRYGITEKDWDTFRKIKPFSPRAGVEWLRPIDILKSDAKGATELYNKFQGMVLQESRHMIPVSTTEAAVSLKGNLRPTTLIGAIATSFSAFKNFPMTYMYLYSRMGLRAETAKGRAGFYAGITAATTLAGMGALALSEVSKGRDIPDFSDPRVVGKAFLKGGGAGLFGDFLFADTGQYGQDIGDVVQGPSLSLAGDLLAIPMGEIRDLTNEMVKEGDLQNYDSKMFDRALKVGRRYTPGSSLWFSATIMQRKFWDALQDMGDPDAAMKRSRQMRQQEQESGTTYWWPMGEGSPERAPAYAGEGNSWR